MKIKKLWLIIPVVLGIISVIAILAFKHTNQKTFDLEDSYYQESKLKDLNVKTLNELIEKKESFAVFVSQAMCIASSDFESVLKEFQKEEKITFYNIAFSDLKETEFKKTIKHYPSFMIFKKGKLVAYLSANKDQDISYYESKEGFKNWFTRYANLKEKANGIEENSDEVENNNKTQIDVNLDYIKKEKNKVNIYLFWGDGCPHCKEEKEFFAKIENKYKKYYNLYLFEVWYHEENEQLLNVFAQAVGKNVTGVPFTIIGSQSFSGFSSDYEKDFINAIETEHKKKNDVYFDKIKK